MKKRILFVAMACLLSSGAFAQGCSLCTKTASELDSKSAKGLNAGILYLAALPLTLLGTIGFLWWKHNRVN
jgi:hypothetical protein